MASATVDLVRSIYTAQEHGDFSSAEWAHADIEYVFAAGGEEIVSVAQQSPKKENPCAAIMAGRGSVGGGSSRP